MRFMPPRPILALALVSAVSCGEQSDGRSATRVGKSRFGGGDFIVPDASAAGSRTLAPLGPPLVSQASATNGLRPQARAHGLRCCG